MVNLGILLKSLRMGTNVHKLKQIVKVYRTPQCFPFYEGKQICDFLFVSLDEEDSTLDLTGYTGSRARGAGKFFLLELKPFKREANNILSDIA